MEQEQLYAAVIVIGVIFSILTNVALYYYGEAKDLKRKVNQGEYLYVRGEDWIEREIRKHHDDRLTNRVTKLENDEDIVRREFLFGKLRDTDRRIVKVEAELKKWMGVSDGSEKR